MKKKILLMALVLCLIAGGNLLAANLLLNPGFETGGKNGQINVGATAIDNWVQWGLNSGWYHSDFDSFRGTRAVKLWNTDTAIYQDFTASVGSVYDVNVYAKSLSTDNTGLHGMNGVIKVQWLDTTKTVEKGTQIIGYYYGDGVSGYDTWILISGMCTPPAGTVYGRVWLKLVDTTGAKKGSLNWDDVSVTQNQYTASNPNPTNGYTIDSNVPITLSWTRPAPRHTGDTIRCDVWFGTDSNMPGGNTKILNKQDANSVSAGTSAGDTDYYWRVDCYDPNTPGSEIKTEGTIWTFTTTNQPPTVNAGVKQAVWLASGTATVTMNATVTDDGFPDPPALLTYSWTVDSGPTPTFDPNNLVKDPNVTFTTNGDCILRLTASDSDKDANDTVKIRVYAADYNGLIAYWKLDETSGNIAYDSSGYGHTGDVNGNPVWTTGQVNGAIELDGTGDYIRIRAGNGTWANLTEEITVSAWIKGIFDEPWQAIVTKGDTSWRLFRDSANGDSNNASFTLSGEGFTPAVSGSTGSVGDNQWHHIVGTFDGVNQCIYVDGILAASHAVPEGSVIDLNYYIVCIGADIEFGSEREFKGLIDEVRLYEIGLTAEMVLEQFIADGGHGSCGLTYLPGDINGDCYVDFADFAEMAESWLKCNDVSNPQCQ
jgi:hypothetical protein